MVELKPDQLLVRQMQVDDLSDVLEIERTAQASPWGRISFEESLTKQHSCRLIVNQDKSANNIESIIAYYVVCPVVDELHILNLVVAKQYQGQGIAHMLMHDIIDSVKNSEVIKKIFLEVRISNEVAQNFYRQWQFKQIAIRQKYYRTPNQEREDALVLVKLLAG